jgi:tyrosinase
LQVLFNWGSVMAVRIRKSVWSLPPGDTTLSWYRKAVDALLKKPISVSTSWRYMAHVHGVPSNVSIPSAAEDFWDQCQHQSWFFLPWHRGYVAAFEAVIANTIAGLGGPADWALPYWNYSEDLSKNPKARLMPPDFFEKTINGQPNALFSRRRQVNNGNFGLDANVVTLRALTLRNFANSVAGRPSGFGGPVTGFNTGGGDNGGLENLPHNAVHGQIGGFMNDPATAALDPIFWLHHCNIDRLWEVWRNQGAAFKNPGTANWLSDVTFNMHDGTGKPFTYVSRDMLDTTKVLHGYQYDNVPVPQPVALESLEVAMADERGQPELAGANEGPITLEGDVTHTEVPLAQKAGLESVAAAPKHVYLSLENITGVGTPGNYKVFVDMPGDGKEPMLAGVMTTFGLERASDSSRDHGGSGLSQVFEITDLAGQLGLTTGTVSHLKVSFVRMETGPVSLESVPGLEDYAPPLDRETSIKVGRVNLFYD